MEDELSTLVGPEGEDWRVPVSELESRQSKLASMLSEAGHEAALIQTPVDLYYYTGAGKMAPYWLLQMGRPAFSYAVQSLALNTNPVEMTLLIR